MAGKGTGKGTEYISKPVITATAAERFVSDLKASCDFFASKLCVLVWRAALLRPG